MTTNRKPNQRDRILDLLSDGQWHDTVELHAICWRYGARLWELRRSGYEFEKRRTADPRIEEWRLIAAPSAGPTETRSSGPPPLPRRRPRRPCSSGNALVVSPGGNPTIARQRSLL